MHHSRQKWNMGKSRERHENFCDDHYIVQIYCIPTDACLRNIDYDINFSLILLFTLFILCRKPAPAELIHVSWLEVTGSYDQLQPGKKYQIKFYLSLKSDAFGWNDCQVFLMAKLGKTGKYKSTKIILNDQNTSAPSEDLNGTPFPTDNFEIEVPSTTPTESDDTKLYFGLYEVWSGKEKGGLQIHKAVVSEV